MDKTTLAHFLRHIPQSNETPQPLPQGVSEGAFLQGFVACLVLWGLVRVTEAGIQASAQTSKYTLNSLAAYIEQEDAIISDWQTRGAYQPNPLANGATFLRWLDEQRLARAEDAPPSRVEHVAQVLIKRTNPITGKSEFLLQYDRNAQQYQLIGGRASPRDNDDRLATITREITEELPLSPLHYGEDYQLDLLLEDLMPPRAISPTFGALTQYHFALYHMRHLKKDLALQDNDRWVTGEELLAGAVRIEGANSVPFHGNNIYPLIHAQLVGGLDHLADSTE